MYLFSAFFFLNFGLQPVVHRVLQVLDGGRCSAWRSHIFFIWLIHFFFQRKIAEGFSSSFYFWKRCTHYFVITERPWNKFIFDTSKRIKWITLKWIRSKFSVTWRFNQIGRVKSIRVCWFRWAYFHFGYSKCKVSKVHCHKWPEWIWIKFVVNSTNHCNPLKFTL